MNLASLELEIRRNPLFFYRKPRYLFFYALIFAGAFSVASFLRLYWIGRIKAAQFFNPQLLKDAAYAVYFLTIAANILMLVSVIFFALAFITAYRLMKPKEH